MIISNYENFLNENKKSFYDINGHEINIGDRVKVVGAGIRDFSGNIGTVTVILKDFLIGKVGVEFDEKFSDLLHNNFDVSNDLRGYFFEGKQLQVIEEPLDDRFEKWEEGVNEEYDYKKK